MKRQQQLTGIGLTAWGFIHVTGLTSKRGSEKKAIYANAHTRCWWQHGGFEVVITRDREVWLRRSLKEGDYREPGLMNLLSQLNVTDNPNVHVPCSGGEVVPSYQLMARVNNPSWEGEHTEYRIWMPEENVTVEHSQLHHSA